MRGLDDKKGNKGEEYGLFSIKEADHVIIRFRPLSSDNAAWAPVSTPPKEAWDRRLNAVRTLAIKAAGYGDNKSNLPVPTAVTVRSEADLKVIEELDAKEEQAREDEYERKIGAAAVREFKNAVLDGRHAEFASRVAASVLARQIEATKIAKGMISAH